MSAAVAKLGRARLGLRAWTRALDAVTEMRDALDHRVWCADPLDITLETDCRALSDLMIAMAAYLEAKRS